MYLNDHHVLVYLLCRATLGEKTKAVYTLTIIHLIFAVLNAWASVSGQSQNGILILFTSVPISITYTIFFSWILNGISTTKESLAARKQRGKLGMYEQLTWILFSFFGAAALFMIGAVVVIISYNHSQSWYAGHWNWLWFFSAGWPMFLNAAACLAIGWIFRPQTFNRSYGMNEVGDFPLDEDDLETQANVALDTLRAHRRGADDGNMRTVDADDDRRKRWNTDSLQAFGDDDDSADEGRQFAKQ